MSETVRKVIKSKTIFLLYNYARQLLATDIISTVIKDPKKNN